MTPTCPVGCATATIHWVWRNLPLSLAEQPLVLQGLENEAARNYTKLSPT